MNFERKFKNIDERIKNLETEQKELKRQYKECQTFTAELLRRCAKRKIVKVAIDRAHKSIPSSISHPFGMFGNVFTNEVKENGWPAIWRVVEEMGISEGCGNGSQHQINSSKLIDGVYHLKNGVWKKIDGVEND